MGLVSGDPADPSEITSSQSAFDAAVTFSDTMTIDTPASASNQALVLPEGYSVYADNTGSGADNSRLWVECPDNGQVVIGPRTGANALADLRLRTDATTASAANCFIDSSTYQIKRSTSSRRYKQDIGAAEVDPRVLDLHPVRFRDRGEVTELGNAAPWHLGLIAEEVHEAGLTELVSYRRPTGDDGEPTGEPVPDGVQYERLAVHLLGVVAQLERRVSALERAAGRG